MEGAPRPLYASSVRYSCASSPRLFSPIQMPVDVARATPKVSAICWTVYRRFAVRTAPLAHAPGLDDPGTSVQRGGRPRRAAGAGGLQALQGSLHDQVAHELGERGDRLEQRPHAAWPSSCRCPAPARSGRRRVRRGRPTSAIISWRFHAARANRVITNTSPASIAAPAAVPGARPAVTRPSTNNLTQPASISASRSESRIAIAGGHATVADPLVHAHFWSSPWPRRGRAPCRACRGRRTTGKAMTVRGRPHSAAAHRPRLGGMGVPSAALPRLRALREVLDRPAREARTP